MPVRMSKYQVSTLQETEVTLFAMIEGKLQGIKLSWEEEV